MSKTYWQGTDVPMSALSKRIIKLLIEADKRDAKPEFIPSGDVRVKVTDSTGSEWHYLHEGD